MRVNDEAMRQEWIKRENVVESYAKNIVFSHNSCCLNKLAGQSKSLCPFKADFSLHRCCVCRFESNPLDHFELFKCRSDKSMILVGHPYDEPSENDINFIKANFPRLHTTIYPKEMSWYLPGGTYRFEIRLQGD